MLPLGHFLVAAVPAVAYVVLRTRTLPSRKLLFVLFVGSQFPDLVDKPLAHQFHLIPNGRMFTHSVVVALPVSLGVLLLARRTDNVPAGLAFLFAYFTHIVGDRRTQLLQPNPQIHPNLLWPLTQVERAQGVPSWAGPGSINVKLWTVFSLVLLLVTASLTRQEVRAHSSTANHR